MAKKKKAILTGARVLKAILKDNLQLSGSLKASGLKAIAKFKK